MKIAVTSEGPTLDHNIEERFGRWPYLLIIDTDTLNFESMKNHNIALGVDPRRAKSIAEKDVSFILAGNCGSTFIRIFEEAGIKVIDRLNGRVMDVVEHFVSCINPFHLLQPQR